MGGNTTDRIAIRTLVVHRDLAYHGGVPRASLTFGRFHDPDAVELHLACLDAPAPEMEAEFARLNVPIHRVVRGGYIRAAVSLRRLLRGQSIDVIICTAFRPYVVAKLAAFGLGLRSVFWIQSIPKVIEGRLRRTLFRILARNDDLLFISRAVSATHIYPAFSGRSRVIYHGLVDPRTEPSIAPYPPGYRRDLGIPLDAVVIGYVAEFIDWKDHDTLLRAFSRVAAAVPNLYLVLVGTGQTVAEAERLAASLPAGDRIRFLGARTDARRLLGVMDFYVHPARGEGFGLAVAEAMLAELPVIAADEGALPEFVVDGETGLLFRAGDVRSLSERITLMLARSDLATALSVKGRAYCLRHFSPSRFAAEFTSFVLDGVKK